MYAIMSSNNNTSQSHTSSSDEEGLFRSKEPRRKPRQRRARLCVNTKPKIRVSQVRDTRRDINDNDESSDSDNEIFSRQSEAGRK